MFKAFLTFAIGIKQWYGRNHGYKTQRNLWKHLAEGCWVLYPPLRGIVQLTNSVALSLQNWSFTNKFIAYPKLKYEKIQS
jgi:hypothetical protein